MKKVTVAIALALLATQTLANVRFIDISKISNDKKITAAYDFVKGNTDYYEHWTNDWKYDKPKQELISKLREHFRLVGELPKKNEETYMLLGDIAHYLYNMDDTAYFRIAVENYESAVKANPRDYRCYWFLGFHYGQSNLPGSAIENIIKAEKLLPEKQPIEFWNDYAWVAGVTNMPSHCIYAMDKVKSISGEAGLFEQQVGESIRKRIVPMDKNLSYKKEEVWTANFGDRVVFTSRPLGIKVLLDSTWDVQVYDYQKNQGIFIIKPPGLANKNGRQITYTVAILMKTANDGDKLADYLSNFVARYPEKKQIEFANAYKNTIAYEIRDKNMYPEIGGAHMYVVGIERPAPAYPGLLLESPQTIPDGDSGVVNFYTPTDSKARFKGKIFYALMLDSCEDIHEQSLAIFKKLLESQISIE